MMLRYLRMIVRLRMKIGKSMQRGFRLFFKELLLLSDFKFNLLEVQYILSYNFKKKHRWKSYYECVWQCQYVSYGIVVAKNYPKYSMSREF